MGVTTDQVERGFAIVLGLTGGPRQSFQMKNSRGLA
jgi:hypothetical protein